MTRQGGRGQADEDGEIVTDSATIVPAGHSTFQSLSPSDTLGGAFFWNIFSGSWGQCHYGFGSSEEPCVRVLVSETSPRVVLMELNNTQTFNMMDPTLCGDVNWAMTVVAQLSGRRHPAAKGNPSAHLTVGAGPHFCPGGNPNPVMPVGISANQASAYNTYIGFTKQRASGLPTLAASHGSQVGGGVAYALSGNVRMCEARTTISFGNLSRGAVPGMHLSRTLPTAVGLSQAFALYLQDSTMSASLAKKSNFAVQVVHGVPALKRQAVLYATRLAASPLGQLLPALRPELPHMRFLSEAVGITQGGKTGEMFANARKKQDEDTVED
mmetsp:Transcript_41930/g.96215  ORF Transcript_41930/g.96215 Transcript_41930/m.96215 type:complete len:326 (+) Transcript_41930:58-1035(+)